MEAHRATHASPPRSLRQNGVGGGTPWISERCFAFWGAFLPWVLLLPIGLLCSWAPTAGAHELTGKITLFSAGGQKPSRDVRHALAYFTPDQPVPLEPQTEPHEIVTVRKEFTPRTLIVPTGSQVQFPNQDTILHNVFSISAANRFDLGLYRRGPGEATTFKKPGIVRVFCNVHQAMIAFVVVVDTPFSTKVGLDGSFRLSDLPAGPGTLTVWHERSPPWTRKLDPAVDGTRPLEVQMEAAKRRVPRHLNKFGKPYARKRGREY